jgi:O-antigen ligase
MFNLLLEILISLTILYFYRKDYIKGVAIAVFFLITLPDALSIRLGSFFDLNVYRLILILLVVFSKVNTQDYSEFSSIPVFSVFLLVLLSNLVSAYISADVKFSMNKFFGFSLLIFLYYFVLVRSIKDKNDIEILLRYIIAGLLIVTVLGLAERYLHFSVIKYMDSDQYARVVSLNGRVTSTYPHPILLGSGLAMGVPLAMYSIQYLKRENFTYLYHITTVLLVATIYLTFSRSAWISLGICFSLGYFLLPKDMRKYMYLIVSLFIVLIYFREGVYKTIDNLYESTFDVNTIKGSSYSYRSELWRVAISKIGESTTRSLFGFGDGSHEIIDLSGSLSYDPNRIVSFKSWDNEYACILLERGVIGFSLYLIMNLYIFLRMVKGRMRLEGQEKILISSLLISNCVFLFTLTTVKMFSVQVVVLYWTNVAIAMRMLDMRGIPNEREG